MTKAAFAEVIKDTGSAVVLMTKDGSRALGRFPYGKGKKYANAKAARAAAHRQEGVIHMKKTKRMGEATHHILVEDLPIRVRPMSEAVLAEGNVGMADIAIIRPGFGNRRDKHYYSEQVLRRDAGVFGGTKMYVTNHQDGEHNVRNWVATVTEAGKRFLKDGTPIATVAVHKEDFWKDLQNLKELGILGKMECSILAVGKARKGKVNGKDANVVESITSAKSIDFVPKGGAGGHVMRLIEAEVGDLDLLTADLLRERRPDLVEELGGAEDEQTLSEVDDMEELESLQEELKELKGQFEAVVAEKDEALTALEETSQVGLKAKAVQLLHEVGAEKGLPKPAIKRLQTDIEAGFWEDDADVEGEVNALVDEELEYLQSVAPETGDDGDEEEKPKPKGEGVKGMGEQYDEGDDPATTSLEERSKSVDSVISRYMGTDVDWTEAHVQ